MKFDENYYQQVISEHGYKAIDFNLIDFNLKNLSKDFLKYKWLCHVDGNKFSKSLLANKRCIVSTGFGLSGIPHVGTVSQMLGAITLQKAGLKVQIVLGDLDSYNSRNQSLTLVNERADQYRQFITAIGFDSNFGILRKQITHLEVLLTAYLSANALKDSDFEETEEDISYLYKEKGIYKGIEFPVKQSILLMASDFINLGKEYENILVTLGIDEHKYVQLARKIVSRQALNVSVAGMYSRLTKGFNGYPKMSKSIPGSGITVDMKPEEILSLICKHKEQEKNPFESTVFQMMCQLSNYQPSELDKLYQSCLEGGSEWDKNKRQYADFVIELFKKWQK